MQNIILNHGDTLQIGKTIHEYINEYGETVIKSFELSYKDSTYNVVGFTPINCIITANTITALSPALVEIYFITDLKDNLIIKNAIIGYEFSGELKLKGFNKNDWE